MVFLGEPRQVGKITLVIEVSNRNFEQFSIQGVSKEGLTSIGIMMRRGKGLLKRNGVKMISSLFLTNSILLWQTYLIHIYILCMIKFMEGENDSNKCLLS